MQHCMDWYNYVQQSATHTPMTVQNYILGGTQKSGKCKLHR